MKKSIKLSEWAKLHDYTYRGAFGLFKRGKLPNSKQLKSGTILIEVEGDQEVEKKPEYNIVYARVSSSENKTNLNSQAERVSQFCNAKGWIVHSIVKECASGLNDARPKLEKILKERKASRLIVEHKDRLTRFGFNYIKTLYPECEIIIINQVVDDKQDLMQDFVSLVTSFCARLYGNRRCKRKTEKLIEDLTKND
jgi:predicted site-specific integrase-resolvase